MCISVPMVPSIHSDLQFIMVLQLPHWYGGYTSYFRFRDHGELLFGKPTQNPSFPFWRRDIERMALGCLWVYHIISLSPSDLQ